MSENLFIFNGVLTATAGSAATAEPLPEANVDANGKVTVVQPGEKSNATSATDNTQKDTGTTAGDTTTSAGGSASGAQTGATSEAGTETAGSAAAQTSGNAAVEGGTEATGTDAGMGGGEVGNMTGEAGMTGGRCRRYGRHGHRDRNLLLCNSERTCHDRYNCRSACAFYISGNSPC